MTGQYLTFLLEKLAKQLIHYQEYPVFVAVHLELQQLIVAALNVLFYCNHDLDD